MKGEALLKIKTLKALGWKHLYVSESEFTCLNPVDLLEKLHKKCE